ncbi:MAG: hypothetical protein AB8I58_20225 [Anaerolineales bacterium]|jgi:hypothetical protein
MRGFYALLLYLYPRRYREEYGEELQAVFNSLFEGALKVGRLEVIKLVLHEFFSLPKAVLLEHLRERRKSRMAKKFASRLDFRRGSWTEAFAALSPFLLFGALPTLIGYFHLMDYAPSWMGVLSVIFFWSFGLGLLVIGFVKRFPRWFMPFIGVPMPLLSLLLFNSLMEKLQGVWWYSLPWLLADVLQQSLLWIGLIFLVILLLVATRFIPRSWTFYQQLRDDWTLLSFVVYGALPFVLFITLNDYKNVEPFMFLALLILAVGGWLYLRSAVPWNKILYLQGGVAFSMWTAAVGKAIFHESSFPWASSSVWQTEFMDTIVTWLWLALIMLIPVAISLMPHSHNASQNTLPS